MIKLLERWTKGKRVLGLIACCWALLFAFGTSAAVASAAPEDPHMEVLTDAMFPSAAECGQCHQKIFQEWASSNHAYASISPMFHKFEQAINDLSSGTIGTFCVRCHQQVGTQLGEKRELPLWERSSVAREGVTCITCHRVAKEFTRMHGEREIMPGPIYDPVYGTGRASSFDEVLSDKSKYQAATAEGEPGTPIHDGFIKFDQLGKSEFCVSCHMVTVNLGIKLEVVWEQYRDSPAFRDGVTCQDCHMGEVPGEPEGYATGHIAIVNGQPVGDGNQRHSNHAFYGPGYPIAHPGIFPFNPRSHRWTIQQWLTFDHEAGWGTREFEDGIADDRNLAPEFPAAFGTRSAREFARVIISQNERLLEYKKRDRLAIMENGMRLDGPYFDGRKPTVGKAMKFRYRVTNIDRGHNVPSGSLGAQPEIWLNVALIDPDGATIWESGYVDSHGDMADLHSFDVREGKLDHDDQLFNLQTKFLTTNIKGTDREMYLPVNFDVDQLPFLRPATVPTTVMNHAPFVRMEGRSIPPLGYRDAKYRIPGKLITKRGTYKLQSRFRSRAEPIYFMKFVGATIDMEKRINEWMIDIHPYAVEFEVQ